jgi:hypothetical protein
MCIGPFAALCIGAAIMAGLEYVSQVHYNTSVRGMDFWNATYYRNLNGGQLGFRAIEGSIMGAAGGLVGGAIKAAGIRGIGAFALGGVADIATGLAWDMSVYGETPSQALLGNMLGFGIGEVIGHGTKRVVRDVANHLCSFSPDTEVATEDGGKPIGDIKVGDDVLAYDEESGEVISGTVTAVWIHTDESIQHLTIDGERLETTPDHPFYTDTDEWVAAGELQVGDRILKADGNYGTVEASETVQQSQKMYNLTIDDEHTFFVGDGQWLVHNTCGREWQYPEAHPAIRLPEWWTDFDVLDDGRKVARSPHIVDKGRQYKGRMFSNARYAGRNLNLAELPDNVLKRYPNLARDYPLGVDLDQYGDPIFDIYAYKNVESVPYIVEISRMSGDSSIADFSKANKLAFGRSGDHPLIPKHLTEAIRVHDQTWHHGLDMKTMIWMPADLHDAVRHTGPDPILRVARQMGHIDW